MTQEELDRYWGRPALRGGALDRRSQTDPWNSPEYLDAALMRPAHDPIRMAAEAHIKQAELEEGRRQHAANLQEAISSREETSAANRAQRRETAEQASLDRAQRAAEAAQYHQDVLGQREGENTTRTQERLLYLSQNPGLLSDDPKQQRAIQQQIARQLAAGAGITIPQVAPDKTTQQARRYAQTAGQPVVGQPSTEQPTTQPAVTQSRTLEPTTETPAAEPPPGRDITGVLYGAAAARPNEPPTFALSQLYGGKSVIPERGPAGYYGGQGQFLGPAVTPQGVHIPKPREAVGLRGAGSQTSTSNLVVNEPNFGQPTTGPDFTGLSPEIPRPAGITDLGPPPATPTIAETTAPVTQPPTPGRPLGITEALTAPPPAPGEKPPGVTTFSPGQYNFLSKYFNVPSVMRPPTEPSRQEIAAQLQRKPENQDQFFF